MQNNICSKHFIIPLIIITLYSISLLFFPLLNSFSFEYNLFLTIPVSLLSAYTTIAYCKKYNPKNISPILLLNCILILIPLVVISIHDAFTVVCNYRYGLALFFLLPFVSMILSMGIALIISLFSLRIFISYLLFLLILAASFAYSIYIFMTEPPIFIYNAFIGYFPGAIYDETIEITSTLKVYRLLILSLGIIFILIYTIKKKSREPRMLVSGVLCALTILVMYVLFNGDTIGFSTSRAYLEKTLGGKITSPHFEIIYDKSLSEEAIDLILNDHERFYEELKATLSVDPKLPLRSYIYKDRKQKKRLMGAQDVLIGDFYKRMMHINFEEPPIHNLKHELAHIFSSAFMGGIIQTSLHIGLAEGFATAMDPHYGKLELHQWAKALQALTMDIPIETLLSSRGFWKHQSAKSYLSMGSFCLFLIDTYGIEKFKSFYKTMEFEKNYGFDLAKGISEWKKYLSSIDLSDIEIAYAQNTFVQKGIFEKVCPHEVSQLEDRGYEFYESKKYNEAYSYFLAAYEKSSEYPLLLHNMIQTKFLENQFDEVIALSEKLLTYNVRKYSNDFALLYIIKSLIAEGKIDEAEARFNEVSLSTLDPLYDEFARLREFFRKK